MDLTREEIEAVLHDWNLAWDGHDLDGVMALLHDQILFENWTGGRATRQRRPSERPGRPGLPITGDSGLYRKTRSSTRRPNRSFFSGVLKAHPWRRGMKAGRRRVAVSMCSGSGTERSFKN